jgi:3-phytase
MEFKGVKTFIVVISVIALSILGVVYCSSPAQQGKSVKQNKKEVLKEAFHTQRDESDNVDSPALWHGEDGQNWLLATAKEGNTVIVFDAANGQKITTFGEPGTGIGQMKRPNGIAVIDSFAVVVERDNHRLQVFALPSLNSLGFFGQKQLIRPYGIATDKTEKGYELYVTDNYELADESIPPVDSLYHRVHHFVLNVNDTALQVNHVRAFGATEGSGVLYKVESILVDRPLNRLLIADEYEMQRNIKIYTIEGEFTGEVIPNKYFKYEPEGIALWSCEADTSGYYITTDQDVLNNWFPVFDRKTLKYMGSFAGEVTRNTDGVALTQHSFGNFENGAFFPVHNDGSITAIGWKEIAMALELKADCPE